MGEVVDQISLKAVGALGALNGKQRVPKTPAMRSIIITLRAKAPSIWPIKERPNLGKCTRNCRVPNATE